MDEVVKSDVDIGVNGKEEKVDKEERLSYDDVQIVPEYSHIKSRSNCNTSTSLTKYIDIDNPIIGSPMDTICEEQMAFELWRLGGIGFIHRFDSIEDQSKRVERTDQKIRNHITKTNNGEIGYSSSEKDKIVTRPILIGASIGATGDYLKRAENLIDAGARVLLIDVAHGHHSYVKEALSELKTKWPSIGFVAGNVATAEGAEALSEWGADSIRVGIGNGAMCTTRLRTGIGIPQISAILQIKDVLNKDDDPPIIADGGIRRPGDMCKAIAAGASTVMVGSLLSGTKETPGPLQRKGVFPDEGLYKQYRGSASFQSKQNRGEETKNIEGTSKTVKYKGKAKRIVDEMVDGLQSSMSYVGVDNIESFQEKAKLIKVTNAGHREGTPHGLG